MNSIFTNLAENLKNFLNNNLSKPREIVLEITDKCNLDCHLCFNKIYTESNNKEYGLSTENVKKIIDIISRSSVRQIRFSGGEPLIREDIFTLIEYAKFKGLRIWLNTNAVLLDKTAAFILSRYVENVLISLNAFDVISEYNVTNKYLFKKKLKGIKLLKDANIKIVRCGTITTKYNIQNLERIYDLVKRLKLDYWELFRPIPAKSNLIPIDNNDIAILIEKLLRINKETGKCYKIYNALPFCCYDPEKVIQVANGAKSDDGHTRFVIDSKGMAKPMYYLTENIGDIFKDHISGLWNHQFMKRLRYLKYVPRICKKCKYLRICKGGSRIVSKLITNLYNQLDYLAQPLKYKKELFN